MAKKLVRRTNMVMEFITGKKYRWTGPNERPYKWASSGEMDAMLDGKPRRCLRGNGTRAEFEGIANGTRY